MNIRTLVCTAAGLLAVLILLTLVPKDLHLPRGIVLPAQSVRSSISPDQVTIYDEKPSGNVMKLGQIRVEFAYHALTQQTHDDMLAKVKTLAASVGANGVVVNVFAPNQGLRRVLFFIGEAIYTPASSEGKK